MSWSRAETPPVVPLRRYLEGTRRLMKGDYYVGRGCRQRGLPRSVFGNPPPPPQGVGLRTYAGYTQVRSYASTGR